MEFFQNLVEYFDEFYPAETEICSFFKELGKNYSFPPKLLQIAAGSGSLALHLAKSGLDVTGIETSQPLLDSANLKRRTQLLSIRFFKMSVLEMARFLGKGFYNVIFCINNRISFIRSKELMVQFFADCRHLLSDDGILVLQLYNYNNFAENSFEPLKKLSPRASLKTALSVENGKVSAISQTIECAQNRQIPILENEPVYHLTKKEIEEFAKKSGFNKVEFYSDFKKTAFSSESEEIVCILS